MPSTTTQGVTTLFDRPLRRDPFLRSWSALVLVLGLFVLNANTTWSGSVEPERVARLLGDMTQLLLLCFLLVALVPALVRRVGRGSARRPASPGRVLAEPAPESPADERSPEPQEEHYAPLTSVEPNGVPPPRITALRLDGNPAAPGLTTRISWKAVGTETVTVDGRSRQPPEGTCEVQLTNTRDIVVVAHGADGSTHTRTKRVTFLALPEVSKVTLPPGPGVSLSAHVSLLAGRDAPALRAVDAVLEGHDVARAALLSPTDGPARVTGLASLARLALDVSWMGHRREDDLPALKTPDESRA